ncbi:sulfurtransferase complex subunit TusD [Enterobacteriaceae endosymbiont of Plateumaris consimilis]|uniref:sulfurtransferase complex subunit TusD n=1 Tax=Enterobacteriaceae endosymbiont of Plateumaris consimilis TaxID=2675794 RepID=UPI00144A0637|nr:sulfurtransferase complex subunit TusD [Enterobacteriaceae endosymbiont of Plateumaris consimilis]QJC28734.1 sulfurtransferase complex subunit TusD [Enterobacteriaceae endosymbiont of Plateumaris consimilis]
MTFSLLVMGSPYSTQNAYSAYFFTNAVIKEKHYVKSIFFYQDGIYNANKYIQLDNYEINLVKYWKNLSNKYHINLYICISSAIKRGMILDKNKILNNQLNHNLIASEFQITSLSILAKSILTCDRFIQF